MTKVVLQAGLEDIVRAESHFSDDYGDGDGSNGIEEGMGSQGREIALYSPYSAVARNSTYCLDMM